MSATTENTSKPWLGRARSTFDLYRDSLLRNVALKLIRPRSQYTADELREKMVVALDDPVGIDRTLKSISPTARKLLKLVDLSRQWRWPVAAMVDVLPFIGGQASVEPIQELLESGLLLPELLAELPIDSMADWLQQLTFDPIHVFVVPLVAERCRSEPLDLQSPTGAKSRLAPSEADGLEWLLRVAVSWQIVQDAPLRQTQNGGLFKRDQDRLRGMTLISAGFSDAPINPVDPALLSVELARRLNVLHTDHDEWVAGTLPRSWGKNIQESLSELWTALSAITTWDPLRGYDPDLLSRKWMLPLGMALTAALLDAPAENWHDVSDLVEWVNARPTDAAQEIPDVSRWCDAFLFGLLHSIGIVEVARSSDHWFLRLSSFARTLFTGGSAVMASAISVQQTLLVQPNLEVIVYRQGLTPELLSLLSRFAQWKTLGLACTLALTPESVYRGLESGISLLEIQRCLERHSTRPLSESVIETLRSWATKRERVQVYPEAILLEFRSATDLEAALKEGIVEQKLTDRIGVAPSEASLNYSRLRMIGSRDYLAAEERCVETDTDGLTLIISDGKADLLLASELRRFSNPLELVHDERSRYLITLESLARAKDGGIDLRWLHDWFQRRTGFGIPSTTRLLFLGKAAGPIAVHTIVVLQVTTREVADGLESWPAMKGILVERLGPTAFAVNSEYADDLRQQLNDAGLDCS